MSEVTIPVGSETKAMHGYLATPNGEAKRPAVIVLHELFGVNEDIRGVVDRLAKLGYVALAPEMYFRDAAAGQSLERNDEGRKQGFAWLNRLDREAVLESVGAAIDLLKARADVDGTKIGVLGFSAGGHMAFLAAAALPIAATALMYPGWLTGGDVSIAKGTPTIDRAPDIAKRDGKVLFAIGGKDAIIVPAQVEEIRTKLDAAKVDAEFVVYPNAEHAFFWEGTPSYDEGSVADTWKRIEAFFGRALST